MQSIASEIHPGRLEALDDARQMHLIRLFHEVATTSPTLVAARFADLPRFIDEVSVALAQRIGADPIDPEVQLATFVIAGLVEVRVQSAFHHVKHATSFAALNDAIHRDYLRAAQLAEPSLTAFDNSRKWPIAERDSLCATQTRKCQPAVVGVRPAAPGRCPPYNGVPVQPVSPLECSVAAVSPLPNQDI